MNNKKLLTLLITSGISVSSAVADNAQSFYGAAAARDNHTQFLHELATSNGPSFGPIDNAVDGCCGGSTCNGSCD